jgi:hypothetical protein
MTGGPKLYPHHLKLLADSAISDEVMRRRGYFTATKPIELRRLGFSTVQAIVPSLVIPIRGIDGEIVSYQARPDQPRIVDGRPVKYESPAGSTAVLDVPTGHGKAVRSSTGALWITEGARKADAAVTAGLVCVSLPGVWSWVSKIGSAKTVLPDLLRIKFTDRKAVIAFDSDVMEKPDVHAALGKLAAWLESQGAWVHCAYLPAGEDEKVGLDDFLATGASVDRLWEYVEQGVRPHAPEPKETVLPTGFLLERIENFLRRFVRFTDERESHEVCVLALYVLHTWALDGAHATPYLHIKSPAKRAGKTRLLEVLQSVCRDSIRASSITASAVFQLIEAKRPTLLIDEVDAIFSARGEYTDALRGVLNDGYKPGGVAIRGTQEGEPREFSTWCPKVLAGIENATLPDTITDRCLVISLERKLKSEPLERLRARKIEASTQEMRDRLNDWAMLAVDRLAEFEVETLDSISDRAEEIAEPLLAIAEDAGGDWPARARSAVLALADQDSGGDDHGTLLLAKLHELFGPVSILSTKEIVKGLREDETLPFAEVNAQQVAKLLAPYGIRPHQIKFQQDNMRGYRRRQFERVWEHYLTPAEAATDATGATDGFPMGTEEVADVAGVADFGAESGYSENGA